MQQKSEPNFSSQSNLCPSPALNWSRAKGRPQVVNLGILIILLGLAAANLPGCSGRMAKLSAPTAPPAGYQRQIMLVVETADFHPVVGAEVRVEVDQPTRLVAPAGGRGSTDGQGGLLLVFEPLPHYDDAVLAGGDVLADFPISAKITVSQGGRVLTTRLLTDQETFARYADPLYQGLNRDPATDITYYNLILP